MTGTSAEAGDDGEVGRGNRVNSLIASLSTRSASRLRPERTPSATSPVNLVALEAAHAIVRGLQAERSTREVFLQSRIGHPVVKPYLSHVRLVLVDPERLEDGPKVHRSGSSRSLESSNCRRRVVHGELAVY